MDLEKYSWTQTLQEVTINIPFPQGVKSRFVAYELKKNHLKVGLKGQPPIIDVSSNCLVLKKFAASLECYLEVISYFLLIGLHVFHTFNTHFHVYRGIFMTRSEWMIVSGI